MKNLRITSFGAFEIMLNGKPIKGFDSDKTRALLAYLMMESDLPHRRDFLAEMFWPGKSEGVARNNLKQALANIRKVIGDNASSPPFLLISRREIQFNADSRSWIDVEEFMKLLECVDSHAHEGTVCCDTCANWLKQSLELYRGDYLEQFYLSDSVAFEEWAMVKREVFQRQMSDALRKLILIFEAKKDYGSARKYVRRLVSLEPWNEQNHRHLMRLLALNGMRSAALKQFHTCRQILADELEVEPAAETLALFEQIKAGQLKALTREGAILENRHSKKETANQPKPLTFRWLALLPALVIFLVGSYVFASKSTRIHSVEDSSIPPVELEILITLYEKTNGKGWENSIGWTSGSSPCVWYGVTCDNSSIIGLELKDNNLRGLIPPELGDLNDLITLDLSFNQLIGTIPPELGNLSSLQYLSLQGNRQLSGAIPPELGKLTNLEILVLSNDQGGTRLSGPIPPELGRLKRLEILQLGNSQLSGPIPPDLGNLTNLVFLDLVKNPLSGSIPPELGNLENLQTLALGEGTNQLSGPLPLSLINLSKLEYLTYSNRTSLCEPQDATFQEWVSSIPEVAGARVVCQDED